MSPSAVVAGVRVVQVDLPGMPVTDPVDIEIAGGRIVAVRPAGPRSDGAIDGQGRFVLPGLVNAHEHLYSKDLRDPPAGFDISAFRKLLDARDEATTLAVMARNAWRSMAEGVLVVRDLGARHGLNTSLARIFDQGILPGPRLVAAGRPVVMTGGHVWTFGREADGPDECRKAVREQRKAGAEVIKIMASGGLSNFPHEDYTVCEFTDAELAAIVDEAHKLGIPTCAHAFGVDAVEAAVRAGVDSIEHGVHLSDEVITRMRELGTGYVPTVANMRRIASPEMNVSAGVPERAERFTRDVVEPQADSLRRAVAACIRVGVGTDSTGTYPGELAALVDAGMDQEQVLRAATVHGAEICRVEAGVVATGRLALLALYDEDPREDLATVTRPAAVFARDRYFERSELLRMGGAGDASA